MADSKTVLRHGLANLMTTITILVSESGLKPAEKESIESRVRMSAMILAYEEVLLGRRQPVFREAVEVVDLLRVLCGVFGGSFGLGGSNPPPSFRVVADRNALADALELICGKWRSDKAPLDIEMNAKKRELVFRHGPGMEWDLGRADLLEEFQKGGAGPEWGFRLALRLLEINDVQVSFPKGEMVLKFRQE
jgi:hypothetical protein